MALSQAELFNCPNCDGRYKLVRALAGPETANGLIECCYRGGPLTFRHGHFVVKCFMADKPRKQAKSSGGKK